VHRRVLNRLLCVGCGIDYNLIADRRRRRVDAMSAEEPLTSRPHDDGESPTAGEAAPPTLVVLNASVWL